MILGPHIRAVYFDAVGTVLHPHPSPFEVYAAAARENGLVLEIPVIRERFLAAFAREEARDRDAGWITSEAREFERWRTIVTTTLHEARDPLACFEHLWNHYAQPHAWRVDPSVTELLTFLTSQGIVLGLASNLDGRLRSVVEKLPEMHRFHTRLAISSEVGYRKPSRQFFETLLRHDGLAPHQMLYVGDDRTNDYDGARAAGMEAWLIDSHDRHPHIPHRVRSLGELLG